MINLIILAAALIYTLCAISIGTLTATIFSKLEVFSPKSVFIVSAFWIVVIPAETIRLVLTKKGQDELATILDVLF